MGATAAIAGGSVLAGALGAKATSDASKRAAGIASDAQAQSQAQFAASQEEMKKAAEYLENLGVPPAEAQRIALEYAQVGPSAMEDIQTDPRLQNAQMDALAKLQQMGGAGLTAEEKAQQMMMQRSGAAQGQARDKAIMQQMAERGLGGSGMELAQRLQASQSGADTAAMAQAQLAGQAQNRALQSISQAGDLGSQIRGQSFAEQANTASAADRIAEFNASNRAAAQQQQEIHNKGLQQQEFQNEMAKRQAVAAARTGTAQAGMQNAAQTAQMGQASAQGAIDAGAAKSQLIGNLAGAGLQAYGASQAKANGGVIGTPEYSYEEGGVVDQSITMQQPSQSGSMPQSPNSNGGFAGGGVPLLEQTPEMYEPEMEGEIVPGDDFEGDRVDAKINSGEMVLNVEQQQRLMELLRGLRDLQGLGDEDIIQPTDGSQMEPVTSNPEMELEFAKGGMVPSEFKTPSNAKPRGLHASLEHERKAEERANTESKERKARIKAYETLAKGGK